MPTHHFLYNSLSFQQQDIGAEIFYFVGFVH